MNIKNNSLLIIFVVILSVIVSSCSPYKKYVKAGMKAFEAEDFTNARENFKEAIKLDSSDLKVLYKYAESNFKTWKYKESEDFFNRVMEQDEKSKFPKSTFWLGMSKKHLGKYAEAMNYFDEFYALNNTTLGPDNYYIKKSSVEISACANSKEFLSKMRDSIEVKTLGDQVNQENFDFAPFQFGSNILYYTSATIDTTIDDDGNESYDMVSRIKKSYLRDSVWSKGQELGYDVYNDTEMSTGNTAFSPNLKTVYFTKCKQLVPTREGCAIYKSKYENGEWREAVKVDEKINKEGSINTQPYVASNGTKGEIMFFASNREGGMGDGRKVDDEEVKTFDIWAAKISPDGEFSEPVNLGETINTIDNEITPYYDAINQTLYFSSDWHEGLGGYDIFKSKGYEDTWTQPENLGFPFNTSGDDNYFHLNQDSKTGYVASNRIGSGVVEGNICCSDIYSFRYKDRDEFLPDEEDIDMMDEQDTISALKACPALIPVTIFFHNDEPDPKTERVTTNLNYAETYSSYKALEEEYIKMFTSVAEDDAKKAELETQIKDFFNENVDKGYNALDLFTGLLLQNLEAGVQVTLTLKGYTSPLNDEEYNVSLAKRRIASLMNFFYTYDNGIFSKYLKGTAESKGFLTFLEEPIGETTCPPNVSDSRVDVINSIYNPIAGVERRCEIVSICLSLNPEQTDKKIEAARENINKEIQEEKAVEDTPKVKEEKVEVKPIVTEPVETNIEDKTEPITNETNTEIKSEGNVEVKEDVKSTTKATPISDDIPDEIRQQLEELEKLDKQKLENKE